MHGLLISMLLYTRKKTHEVYEFSSVKVLNIESSRLQTPNTYPMIFLNSFLTLYGVTNQSSTNLSIQKWFVASQLRKAFLTRLTVLNLTAMNQSMLWITWFSPEVIPYSPANEILCNIVISASLIHINKEVSCFHNGIEYTSV